MAEIWGAALAAAGAIGGAAMSANAARQSSKDMARTQASLQTTLGNARFFGPGGITTDVYDQGQTNSINLGDLDPARRFLTQFGTDASAQAAGMGDLPDAIRQALGQTQAFQGTPGMPNTQGLQSGVDSIFGQSLQDLQGGVQGFQDRTLQTLRSQAAPFEQRAFNSLQNNQFATGRLGTSGGGMQTEAFARGLGQADTDRQIQATTLGNQMLNDAFSRFGQTAGLSQGLQQERFGNSVLLNNTGYDRANQNFQNQIAGAQVPQALQGNQLQLALQALQGQGFLNDQGLAQFQATLAAAQAGANTRVGAGSNVSAVAGARAGMPTSGDIWGQALTGLAGRIDPSGGNGILGGLFGSKQPSYIPSNTPTDPGFVGPVRAVK